MSGHTGCGMARQLTTTGHGLTQASGLALAMVLERAGWFLNRADVDLDAGTLFLSASSNHDGSGRVVVLHVPSAGRPTLTREQVGHHWSHRGRYPQLNRSANLLGRDYVDGVRSGLRHFANYVADNSRVSALRHEIRGALLPLIVVAEIRESQTQGAGR